MTTVTYGREASHTKGSDFGPGIMGRVKGYFARTRAERQLHQLDDRMLAEAIARALRQSAHLVSHAARGDEADDALAAGEFDLVLLDVGPYLSFD